MPEIYEAFCETCVHGRKEGKVFFCTKSITGEAYPPCHYCTSWKSKDGTHYLSRSAEGNKTCTLLDKYGHSYDREARAVEDLKEWLGRHFKVYTEVPGKKLHTRHFKNDKRGVRIDLIAVPTENTILSGWRSGIIGFECKKSGLKIGKTFAQCLDYMDSGFTLNRGNLCVTLDYCFAFPVAKQGGPLGSMLTSTHIGTASFDLSMGHRHLYYLDLLCGETRVAKIYYDSIEMKQQDHGKRQGSQ